MKNIDKILAVLLIASVITIIYLFNRALGEPVTKKNPQRQEFWNY